MPQLHICSACSIHLPSCSWISSSLFPSCTWLHLIHTYCCEFLHLLFHLLCVPTCKKKKKHSKAIKSATVLEKISALNPKWWWMLTVKHVTHLKGINYRLGDSSSKRSCHKALHDGQFSLLASTKLQDQALALLISCKLDGRLWCNLEDVDAVASPQWPDASFLQEVLEAGSQPGVFTAVNLNTRHIPLRSTLTQNLTLLKLNQTLTLTWLNFLYPKLSTSYIQYTQSMHLAPSRVL